MAALTERLRIPLVVLMALIIQISVAEQLRLFGVVPDLMLLVAVAAGLAAPPERAAPIAFASGLVIDIYLQTPLGLSALTFTLVSYLVAMLRERSVERVWWMTIVVGAVASAAGEAMFALGGAVVGRSDLVDPHLLVVAAVVGTVNGLLAPLAVRVLDWAVPEELGVARA